MRRALAALPLMLAAQSLALGGNDLDAVNQIDQATAWCQSEITKRGVKLAAKVGDSVRQCLDAVLKCEEESTAIAALACRRKLLAPGTGKCAEGRLDLGVSLLGDGASAHAQANRGTRARLVKELNKYVDSIGRKCGSADTSDDPSGLGFGGELDPAALADLTNANPTGLGCHALGLVLAAMPRASEALAVISPLHETCVAADDAALLGADCSAGEAACGPGGVCGRLARIVLGAPGASGLEDCSVRSCGPGTSECSGVCTNPSVDPSHCGGCGSACGPTAFCSGASCVPCPGGQTQCDNVCVDTGTDPANCGGCAVVCGPGRICNAGSCELPPPSDIWQPAPGTSWQWQLQGTIDTSFDVDMYDLDLFDVPQATLDGLKTQGRVVICYFSAGTFEGWRPDATDFPPSLLGNTVSGFPDERWLDIRQLSTLAPIMQARLDLALSKGCDGVEPDNVDAYQNDPGFPLTAADQLAYNRFLATEAHARSLSVGLKNDLGQIPELVDDFDWALNEQCFQFDECNLLSPFVARGKAVFGVEYQGNPATFCPVLNALSFSWLEKNLALDAFRVDCADFP